jgi:DNA-binding protein HU-beta
MSVRISFDDLLERATQRTGQDQQVARLAVEAFLDEIYQSMKRGESVTIRDFGGFYVRPERNTWVFKFSPSQKWKSAFGWASSYKGDG